MEDYLDYMSCHNHWYEFVYLAFTRMPDESYRRRFRSLLLCLCDVFRELINSLMYFIGTKENSSVKTQTSPRKSVLVADSSMIENAGMPSN